MRITYGHLLMVGTVAMFGAALMFVISDPTNDELCRTPSHAYCNTQRIQQLEADVELLKIRAERIDSVVTWADRYSVPPRLAGIVLDAAWATATPLELAFRLVGVESAFDSLAVSSKGAIGLTQVLPTTGDEFCPGWDLYDPRLNARCGFLYLHHLLEKYDGNLDDALRHYNGGRRAVGNERHVSRHYAEEVCGGNCEEIY